MKKKTNQEELSNELLINLGFSNVEESVFESLSMPYFANNGVLLFYNTPQHDWTKKDFLVGYGEMRSGKYYAVAFRWIDKKEQLVEIYRAITGKELIQTEPAPC